MATRVRKAVFPVAGLGTRLLPATKSIPKEMITIVDRPLIQYAVDEAREAGIEQLIFVTGRGKAALVDYFDVDFELEATLREKGKSLDVMAGKPGALKQMVDAWSTVGGNLVATEEVPAEKTNSYGIITPGETNGDLTEVRGLVEKPDPAKAPSRLGVIGRYILQPEVMRVLDSGEKGAGGEIQLTDA